MVKFGLNGSDATTAAVRLARAYTGRDVVAVCRQHSFFSTHDWFIVTMPMSAGSPAAERLMVSPPFCWAHEKGSVKVGSAPSNEATAGTAPAAADFRNSPLSITGIPQGTSGAEGLG